MRGERSGAGHGKLLLFGEHAAVHGYPACGLTLPGQIRVRIRPAAAWRILTAGGPKDDEIAAAVEEFLAQSEALFPAGRLERGELLIESDIPPGMGFGSSAAWCVAIVRALLPPATPSDEIWSLAHRAERFFHGTPSGIDTGLAILDGLYAFSPAAPSLPAARRLRGVALHLLVGAVPREGSTRALVGALKQRIDSNEREATQTVARLGALSERAIELLASGDDGSVGELGRLAVEAQRALAHLGLSTASLDALLAAGTACGALGGKLSGAGGGGAFFLLFDEPARADAALETLKGQFCGPRRSDAPILFRYSFQPGAAHEARRASSER